MPTNRERADMIQRDAGDGTYRGYDEEPSARLRTVHRCDANARKGTGTGMCNERLANREAQCPNASNHLD